VSPDLIRQLQSSSFSLFGITLIVPQAQLWIERMFSAISSKFQINQNNKSGLGGGIIIGASLGLLWTPCVGPILATVISLALTETVTASAVFITLAYALGTAIPMFVIMRGGQSVLQKNRWLLTRGALIQQIFGVIMIATAVVLYFNIDRKFQTFILQTFPNYGTGLTSFEQNSLINSALQNIRGTSKTSDKYKKSGIMLQNYGSAPELTVGGEWLNTEPLTLAGLKRKVVLIDFWTYTCINCIRTLPYLRTWDEKYRDKGLTIIGVHAPNLSLKC
jgi:hypothetical protein